MTNKARSLKGVSVISWSTRILNQTQSSLFFAMTVVKVIIVIAQHPLLFTKTYTFDRLTHQMVNVAS